MQNISLVTDTTSDIPPYLCHKYGIEMVPMYVGYQGNLYREGTEITNQQVYAKLEAGIKVHTSGPSVGDFIQAYKKILNLDKNTIIFSIHLSSRLSSTFNNAVQASKYFPHSRIKVIDSNTAAISLGFMVLEAARAAIRNEDPEEIEKNIEFMIRNNRLFASFDNFKYLFMGGRAPFLKQFLSRAIFLKPILVLDGGKVKLKKFARNKEKSIAELYKQIKKDPYPDLKKKIGIFYGAEKKPALNLKTMIENDPKIIVDEIILTEITTVISGHTGPGIWGITSCPVLGSAQTT